MIDGLREKIKSNIENFNGEYGNWVSDIKSYITSSYYPDVMRAFREMADMSYGKNEDGSLYYLPFRIDTMGDVGDNERFTVAFTDVNIGEERFSIRFDSCVEDSFANINEFIDVIMKLTEEAERVRNIFNSLRPIYNERV